MLTPLLAGGVDPAFELQDLLPEALALGQRLSGVNGFAVRGPVHGPDFFERGVMGRFIGAANAVYEFVEGYGDNPFEKIPPYRYCWPPAR